MKGFNLTKAQQDVLTLLLDGWVIQEYNGFFNLVDGFGVRRSVQEKTVNKLLEMKLIKKINTPDEITTYR